MVSLLSVACACGAMQAVNNILIYCCRYLGQLLYFKCCDYARGCRILSQDHERKSMANNVERRRWSLWRVVKRGIVPPRAQIASEIPTKKYRLAITTLRTPDIRRSQRGNNSPTTLTPLPLPLWLRTTLPIHVRQLRGIYSVHQFVMLFLAKYCQ